MYRALGMLIAAAGLVNDAHARCVVDDDSQGSRTFMRCGDTQWMVPNGPELTWPAATTACAEARIDGEWTLPRADAFRALRQSLRQAYCGDRECEGPRLFSQDGPFVWVQGAAGGDHEVVRWDTGTSALADTHEQKAAVVCIRRPGS